MLSYLEQVTKEGEAHYVLPRTGKMLVDVHAFFSEELFAATDEKIWRQAANAATTYPGVKRAYLMPDAHAGFHVPIGSVVVTDDVMAQGSVGYDVNCGVLLAKIVGLHARHLVDPAERLRWVREIESRVALGIGSHRPPKAPKISARQVEDMCLHGAEPLGVGDELCERVSLPVPEGYDPRWLDKAWDKATPQMGSLGGGNHFIELQVDGGTGEVFVQVHCGSRGYGWQIANHFFYAGAEHRGFERKRREESWLRRGEPLGEQFWAAHNAAANYAIANRWVIYKGIEAATRVVFGRGLEPVYEISHNLAQREVLPTGEWGYVNRKGATRAFPAKHPQLRNTKWEMTGHPCLIPGSMLAGAAVLMPGTAAIRSGYSVNHGSGRLMGRKEAQRTLAAAHDEIDREMRTIRRTFDGVEIEGIVMNTERTPLDESGRAYKELDAVIDVLVQENLATVKNRMFPVANLKGTD